jgi:hypothetical protein
LHFTLGASIKKYDHSVFTRFFNGKLAGIQKAGCIGQNDEKAEWEIEPGSNPPEEASGINAIRFCLL